MDAPNAAALLQRGALAPGTAALVWLLVDGGVPLLVAGHSPRTERVQLAAALLAVDPSRKWIVLDGDADDISTHRLSAIMRGGVALGITLAASRLEDVIDRLEAGGLPQDAVRRLGVVVIAEETTVGLRCRVVHYLRPTERDAQGHVQRRPPAVLSAWDPGADAHEDFAWGITPELADRVDRSQADLEERQADRARLLEGLVRSVPVDFGVRVSAYLATEPPRVPAPKHPPARSSPFHGGLTDPH